MILREGFTENWEVFVVEDTLLKFLPATYFGNPLACKSNDGYLCAILLERLNVDELMKLLHDLEHSLENLIFYLTEV